VHCIGDAATDLALEAYEGAMNANPRSNPRHRIEHAVLTTPQSTQKMKDLSVVVSTQPAFIYLFGDGWKMLFGEERMDRIMVTKEWVEAGVHLTIGSDAPSTPFYNPQSTLAGAMSRSSIKQTPIAPDQVSAHQEHMLGSLETGKFADLVVWTQDPSQLTLQELALTKTVDMTLVGGKTVYQV
jgi:predicted amidohydrolase YtcJ